MSAMRSARVDDPEVGSERAAPFRAVLIYEDVATRIQTRCATDFAIGWLEPVFSFDKALWNISEIGLGSLSALTGEQSAAAEIVVISMRDGSGLSSSLRIWLNKWILSRKGMCSALVVLFDYPGQDTDFARRHLRNAAERAGIEFFTQTGALPDEEFHSDGLMMAV